MILPQSEIRDLTGYVRVSAQIRWLRKHGWKFVVSGKGEPKVARAEYQRLTNRAETYSPPVPLLPVDALRALPRELPERDQSGVYFLWRLDELLYIGHSRAISWRIYQHDCARRIPYLYFTFIVSRHLESREDLEAAYIRAYLPPFNRQVR